LFIIDPSIQSDKNLEFVIPISKIDLLVKFVSGLHFLLINIFIGKMSTTIFLLGFDNFVVKYVGNYFFKKYADISCLLLLLFLNLMVIDVLFKFVCSFIDKVFLLNTSCYKLI